MKKQYIAPSLVAVSYIEPLSPLCDSKVFGIGSSDDGEKGGTTSSVWSNKQQTPNQGGMWSHMDD